MRLDHASGVIRERWPSRFATTHAAVYVAVVASLPDLPYHDAEILRVFLDRGGPTLELDLELFAQLPETRVVRLRFTDVAEVELGDFNEQNVLFDLLAEPRPDDRIRIDLQSSYGLGGSFECSAVAVVDQ